MMKSIDPDLVLPVVRKTFCCKPFATHLPTDRQRAARSLHTHYLQRGVRQMKALHTVAYLYGIAPRTVYRILNRDFQ